MQDSLTASLNQTAIIFASLSLLIFGTAIVVAYHYVRALETKVNRQLRSVGFHWQDFKLYPVPKTLAERTAFYFRMGTRKGQPEGSIPDPLTFFVVSTEILFRWMLYPQIKKKSVRILANSDDLPHEQVVALVNQLK